LGSLGKNESKLKILVVHEINYREKVIYEIHEFPELLAEAGHEVEFLEFAEGYTGKPGANQRSWTQAGRVYKDARFRIHSPWLSGIPVLDRLVGVVSVLPILWGMRRSKFDVILNFAVPTFGLQVILFALFSGTPVVHRALDVAHKIRESPWNPAIWLVERLVLSFSTLISSNSPSMSRYVAGRLFRRVQTRVNLPPSLSPGMRRVEYDSKLAATLGLEMDDFVVAYLGSFFYFSGLDLVIKDLAQRRKASPSLRLLLIGGGEQEAELMSLCGDLGLDDIVVFAGYIPFSEIPRYLSLADVGINPMKYGSVSNFALPNKVIQYLALDLPAVSTKLEGLYSVFGSSGLVAWADQPEDVLGVSLTNVFGKRKVPSETHSALDQFEPSSSLSSLMAALQEAIRASKKLR